MKKRHIWMIVLSLLIVVSGLPAPTSLAATNYVTATKTINPSSILVGGETEVTLSIKGTPPVNVVKPNDVILIIDRSGSMGTEKMNSAKSAAKGFIDLMDLTKHRIGIVDYSTDSATFDLTTDAQKAKAYIDTLFANGGTSTGDAIKKAQELLAAHRDDAQPVIVLLTDGEATGTGDGLDDPFDYTLKKAGEAKDAGIVFYTIALLNAADNPDTSAPNILLKNMATTAHHHHFVLGSQDLSAIYAAIVQEIGLASAYDVVVKDVVPSGFEIVPGSYDNNIPKPTVDGNTLTWNFLELKNDTLNFTYKIRQKPDGSNGIFPVSTTSSVITYKDYTGAVKSYNIPSVNLEVKYPAPIISNVTPEKGLVTGGDSITIQGQNFRPNAKVSIGGKAATNITVVSANEITATTPTGTQGSAVVKVTNDDNQSANGNFAYYAIPEITSIAPSNGPSAGGTNVKIYGKYFMNGAKVKFGDNYSTSVTFYNDTYLYVKAPASQVWGPVDVAVENPDETSALSKGGFTYNEPPKLTVSSITPNQGYTTGNETVTIAGTEFKNGAKVYFGDTESPSVVVNSDVKLTVKTPVAAQESTVDVKVVNPDGAESILPQSFSFVAPPPPKGPTITTVTPNSGRLDVNTLIYVDGSDFVQGAKIFIGDTELTADFLSSTRLRVRTPLWPQPETVAVKVVNPDGQFSMLDAGFTFLAPPPKPDPVITSVTPANGPMAGGTLIYVDGSNYQQGAKLYMIQNGVETELSAEYLSSSRLRLRTPASTEPGSVDFKVVNPDSKEAVLLSAFTYNTPPVIPDPVISSISPAVGNKKGGNIVDIYGTDIQQGATVTFGSTTVNLYSFVDSTHVRVKAPASILATTVDVTLTNPNGKSSSLVNAYTYQESQPEITAVTPGNGALAGGTLVYVDGLYFEPNLTVTFNGSPLTYEYLSATRIRFRTPAGSSPGPVDFVITNPSGISATAQFTYDAPPTVPAPVLKSLSPTSGSVNGGTLLYVDGSNFKSGAKVNIDGIDYEASFLSSTRVRLRTPKGTAPGLVPVKVVNPDGQESGIIYFEYK